jgi:RimJ/RimL family protein N-acetyltransferase
MDYVFDVLGWADTVHLIHADNTASRRVAEKLGSRNLGRRMEVPGFAGMMVDIWGQDAADWRSRPARTG